MENIDYLIQSKQVRSQVDGEHYIIVNVPTPLRPGIGNQPDQYAVKIADFKKSVLGSGSGGSGSVSSPKVYRALLTQTLTNDPVVVELQNDLGFAVVWNYSDAGHYSAPGTFPPNTSIYLGSNYNQSIYDSGVAQTTNSPTSVDIWTFQDSISGIAINGFLLNTAIRIEIDE